jgi:hypothetical protein
MISQHRLHKTVKFVNDKFKDQRGIFFMRLGSQGSLEYLFERSPRHVGK